MMLIRINRSADLEEVFREAEHWQVHVQYVIVFSQMYESRMKSTEKSSHACIIGENRFKKSRHAVPKSVFPDPELLV